VRIKAIEPIAVSLPMRKPVRMSGETVARADNVFVRVESDDGAVGWGEAASAPLMTGETVAGMTAAIAHLTPGLISRDAEDFAGATAVMDARLYGNSGAKAAIAIALYDLVGRATGRPVYALLGAKQRGRMATLAVIGSPIILAASGADLAAHQALRAAIGGQLVLIFVRSTIQFCRRSQRAIIINNIFLAVISQLEIVLLQKVVCFFGGFQIIRARKFSRHRIRARHHQRRDRHAAS